MAKGDVTITLTPDEQFLISEALHVVAGFLKGNEDYKPSPALLEELAPLVGEAFSIQIKMGNKRFELTASEQDELRQLKGLAVAKNAKRD